MRQLAIIIALAVAPMAGQIFTSAIDSLTWPALTASGITVFSAFFIFTIMTAQSPIQWKLPVRIQPAIAEHLKNVLQLLLILILFFAVAVMFVAAAATGPGQSFPSSLMYVLKCIL